MDSVGGSEASTVRAIEKLASLLTEEARLLRGIERSEVESLKNELQVIRHFLRDIDARSDEVELSEAVKTWSNQLKEVAELIEDVFDEYILKVSQGKHQRGFVSFLGKAGRLIGTLNSRRNLSWNIQNIKRLLYEIKERGQIYDIRASNSRAAARRRARFTNPLISETAVGIDSITNELTHRLVEGQPRRSIISLTGMAGIGKTTLAAKVYYSEEVRQYFDYLEWISVSRSYNVEELLRIMIKKIGAAGSHEGGSRELIDILRQYLQSKRYLFVFDDVWQEDFWENVKYAFPDNDVGSRIIITTRSVAVAASCRETSFDHIHMLEPLTAAISWELFCSRAFLDEDERRCPLELEQVSLEIVRMCQGLPLAIVAIAGLLSRKNRTMFEWKRVLDNFHFELQSGPDPLNISKIVALSFHDLPYHLKMCFLYFSIFPKDSLIPNDKLFKLWVAEDFVQARGLMTSEEVAEQYLNELVQRNLVQTSGGFYGLEQFSRVHGLMHDMAQQKAEEFSFCQVQDDKNSSLRGKSRRLSISNKIEVNVLETTEDSRVRSVFLSNIGALNNTFVASLFRKYKLLTLLDFENVPLPRLPDEVGNLFHLKYLSLKNTKVKRLPKSVGKLQNLQTLDLRQTPLVELPVEINMLRNLRHLLAGDYDSNISLNSAQGVRIKEGIGYLESLQTLMTVEAYFGGIDLAMGLENLRGLRRLGISGLTEEVVRVLFRSIEKMNHLQYLSLHSTAEEILNLETFSSPLIFLQRVVLRGPLRSLPNWISRLANLSMLYLSHSRLSDDPLRHICVLPNLVSLWLYEAYEGEHLHFVTHGFLKLKLLVLGDLRRLREVEIEEGALPVLEELRIGPSQLLDEVPSGIQHLRSLKVLEFYGLPKELVFSIQPDGGLDYVKIEHVPSVLFWYRVRGTDYELYELGDPKLLDLLQDFSHSNDESDSASTSTSTSFFPWDDMRLSLSRDSSFSARWSICSDDIED